MDAISKWGTSAGASPAITEKYDKPAIIEEKFNTRSSSEPRDDQSKMYEVKFDRCRYSSIFELEAGTIELSIDHESVSKCFVKLIYSDKINSSIIKAKAKDDL